MEKSFELSIKMSWTFTFTGRTSVLEANIFPPIDLNPQKNYEIGLIDFQTYNTIPNIDDSNNILHYETDGRQHSITIPTGQYEIEELNRYIRRALRVTFVSDEYYYQLHHDNIHAGPFFKLIPNVNTLKCSLISSHTIDFTKPKSVGQLLGFTKKLEPYKIHEGETTVDIFKVNTIQIDCNIAMDSYQNGKLVHTIHEFFPTVPSGYKITEVPATIIYLPVNTRRIDNITVKIIDQAGRHIDFRGEEITLRLHLKAAV